MRINYLNTDLEIESKSNLADLVTWLADEELFVLGHQKFKKLDYASFEFISEGSEDATINRFCEYLECLPENLKQIWDGCCKKAFDIGYSYEVSDNPVSLCSTLSDKTLSRVAALGASIIITIYPHDT